MVNAAAVVSWPAAADGDGVLAALERCPAVRHVAIAGPADARPSDHGYASIDADRFWSGAATARVLRWFEKTEADFLIWVFSTLADVPATGLSRLLQAAIDTRAAIVYSDYFVRGSDASVSWHALLDYQAGSLRDDFDFGHIVVLARAALRGMAESIEGAGSPTLFGGWYDLRLRLSERYPVTHLPEPTYTVPASCASGDRHFAYVDPRQRTYQEEMERIATAHLQRIGAFLESPDRPLVAESASFPVTASVVIPVRNRARTIGEAVASGLAQQASFPFNVIVVDNHSNDGTTQILAEMAVRDPRLVHRIPSRVDLGIGGCWNEAIHDVACGRYAVQLDSDDLYGGNDVLARIVAAFQRSRCAMVIGAYTLVDFDLNRIPPGLVDHREWTEENGANNALRIAGLGAPRAFHVPTLRTIGFPNVSYGEDYAVGLRLTRTYRLERIYDSLYWCRRWEDNTDHALPLATRNRYAAYKDRLRSIEILARQSHSR